MSQPPPWAGRRAAEALKRVRALGQASNARCCICDTAIDYRLRYPSPWSCSVQHVLSRSLRPDLTWSPANWLPAHLQCNREAGDGTGVNPYDLGIA